MKMLFNKQIILTCVAIVIVCVFSFSLATKEKKENLTDPTQVVENLTNQEIDANINTPTSYDYIIKVHEGKIAVFLVGSNVPEMIFDVYIHHLPEYDKQQLIKGVPIKDYPALVAAIEDYIS